MQVLLFLFLEGESNQKQIKERRVRMCLNLRLICGATFQGKNCIHISMFDEENALGCIKRSSSFVNHVFRNEGIQCRFLDDQ